MDDRSGDFVEHGGPLDINLRTLFHFRKPYPPRIDPCVLKRAIPPQPLPISYTTMSWIWGGAPITGAQFDTLSQSTSCTSESALLTPSCGAKQTTSTESTTPTQTTPHLMGQTPRGAHQTAYSFCRHHAQAYSSREAISTYTRCERKGRCVYRDAERCGGKRKLFG